MVVEMSGVVKGWIPVVLMVVFQTGYAGMIILVKMAATDGMNLRIFSAYRFLSATIFLTPLAFFFEQKNRAKLTKMVLLQAFLAALFGGLLAQNFFVESLALTSATFSAAMTNLIPAVTFIMSILFRLERLELNTVSGKAKLGGTLIGLSGAMLITFYKGMEFRLWSTHADVAHPNETHVVQPHKQHGTGGHILGSFLAFANCIAYSIWLIAQAKLSKKYHSHYSGAALVTSMASVQCVVAALAMERNWSEWGFGWNIKLLATAYMGIVSTALSLPLIHWCMKMRGPVFASAFMPLSLVVVAILGTFILKENLFLGSLLGGMLIVCGVYMVLWGKSKEMKQQQQQSNLLATEANHSVEIISK
ncbi:WAT1-related protein At1g25270-like [Mercurialis annua]|uniref:WAT1-related protein At1g25270-like n=1 Tax=Mercurialis annua TaxID=3986 RepID=UPI002160B9E1|nr:WAT1-related protein At1g25270-like [Mercurialis annua]